MRDRGFIVVMPEFSRQAWFNLYGGQFFDEQDQQQAAAWGIPLGWTLATAPGVSHSSAGMAKYAVEVRYPPLSPTPPRQP